MRYLFELSIALKYLIPRKKQLSVSLISLLSVGVISLVVWLVLVFLSVTEGIERGWLNKLTALNAPLRITPTEHYYSSYYYQIDAVSGQSQYASKSIGEKALAAKADPFDAVEDGELPVHFPEPDLGDKGDLRDPVKGLYQVLSGLKKSRSDLVFQDFELSGALMRLQLLRPGTGMQGDSQNYLTQVSYLASVPDKCPQFSTLVLSPSEKDLNHLFYLAAHTTEMSRQDSPALTMKTSKEIAQQRIRSLLNQSTIKELKSRYAYWQLPLALIPENKSFVGEAQYRNGKLHRIDLPLLETGLKASKNRVKVWKEGGQLIMEDEKGKKERLPVHFPLLVDSQVRFDVIGAAVADTLLFKVQSQLQGATLSGQIGLDGLEISRAHLKAGIEPVLRDEKETGVWLTKSYIDNGVLVGDRGYLSYSSSTSSSVQEHRMPIYVAGFYDPGILSIGNKCILVPPDVTRTINASSSSFNLDKLQSNGILVWFKNLEEAQAVKAEILAELEKQGLSKYWKATTFREYDFAKDLLEQFQSDKYLFTLVGVIILLVACCNIISLLVLLVNDKKQEIGILQAMGASKFSIAAIFGVCGMAMGILSSLIGTLAALFTLHHIDAIVKLLSLIQGHDAFNTTFFGSNLPDQLSHNAVTFILITTPFLSLIAGLVPAIKACRLRPSNILRS